MVSDATKTRQHYIIEIFLLRKSAAACRNWSFPREISNPWQDEKSSDVNGEDVEGTQMTSVDPSPEAGRRGSSMSW